MGEAQDGPGLGYASFRMAPRAPRAAVVVPGGDAWRHWARLALHEACGIWGGAGFVLVPHDRGVVHPRLLSAVAAYDPDYVLLMDPPFGDYEALLPGEAELVDGSGSPLDEQVRAETVARQVDSRWPVAGGDQARQAVAEACSPYRRWDADRQAWEEDQQWWAGEAPGYPFVAASALAVDEQAAVSVLQNASGDAALALTARIGTFLRPDPMSSLSAPAVASEEEEMDQARAAAWLIAGNGEPPQGMLSAATAAGPTAFEAGSVGLTPVGGAAVRIRPALVVAGDTAEDFALALIWDRISGRGIWLPHAWWPTTPGKAAALAGAALDLTVGRAARRHPAYRVTSMSAGPEEIEALLDRLRARAAAAPVGRSASRPRREPVALQEPGPWPGPGSLHLAVQGQFDQRFALPVRRSAEVYGGFEMAAPPPPPSVTAPELGGHLHALRWEVDLQSDRSLMPTGRALDGHVLFAGGEDPWLTWVRSGRDGISYGATRYDFVLAGTAVESALARPRLRELGLLEWANAIGLPQGRSFRLSDAGLRVDVLTRLAGGRADLADLLTGPLLPAMRAFDPAAKSTTGAYPNGEGVVLVDGGYLVFDGLVSLAAGQAPEEVRAAADRMLSAGLLRRGLVLDCSACQKLSFVLIERLGQRNECPRCGQQNELVHDRWNRFGNEPAWFYDLHTAARELFRQHGDVPLLLSAHLRTSARAYADIAELEMVDAANGNSLAETDLLAVADGRVITAEAKSNDALADSGKKIRSAAEKRVDLAVALRADEIVLATTRPAWTPASIDAIRAAIAAKHWPRGEPPTLRAVCGLGGKITNTVL